MKRMKIFTVILSAVLAAGILAGCALPYVGRNVSAAVSASFEEADIAITCALTEEEIRK